MFEKKYIFETRQTRFKRFFFNRFIVFISIIVIFVTLCIYIPYYPNTLNQDAKTLLTTNTPDLIVIFTGDQNRIPLGLEVAAKYPSAQIYISGVFVKNSVQTLVQQLGEELSAEMQSRIIDLDYYARNTVENVLFTLHHLRKTQEHKTIFVVSSDYHILRIKMIFDFLIQDQDKLNIFYLASHSDYTQWRSLKILFKEVIKLIKASIFLLMWDGDKEILCPQPPCPLIIDD